jgi:hypothetical protein
MLVAATLFSLSTVAFAANNYTFKDVSKNEWYYQSVWYCAHGYVTGYGGAKTGYFGPTDLVQRQDFAVMMLRFGHWGTKTTSQQNADPVLGKPNYKTSLDSYNVNYCTAKERNSLDTYIKNNGTYNDVAKGSYYYYSVYGLKKANIMTGYSSGNFGVGDPITREQAATIIYRYEGSPYMSKSAVNKVLSRYLDGYTTSEWARTAIAWCIENHIIKGKTKMWKDIGEVAYRIAPTDYITRAEVTTILMRVDGDSDLHSGYYLPDNKFTCAVG